MMQGVSVKMITGDHQAIARETARQLGMGDNISSAANLPTLAAGDAPPTTLGRDYGEMITNSDGFAGVYPEHKFLIVETLRQLGHSVGMTGDGVNDAPALKKADVGIAVEGATDAARAAADLVLTAPGLSVIVDAIEISRAIFQRMKNYVIYRVACTIQLLLFFFVAVFAFEPHWYNDKSVWANGCIVEARKFALQARIAALDRIVQASFLGILQILFEDEFLSSVNVRDLGTAQQKRREPVIRVARRGVLGQQRVESLLGRSRHHHTVLAVLVAG
jgi:hypothetical protein